MLDMSEQKGKKEVLINWVKFKSDRKNCISGIQSSVGCWRSLFSPYPQFCFYQSDFLYILNSCRQFGGNQLLLGIECRAYTYALLLESHLQALDCIKKGQGGSLVNRILAFCAVFCPVFHAFMSLERSWPFSPSTVRCGQSQN